MPNLSAIGNCPFPPFPSSLLRGNTSLFDLNSDIDQLPEPLLPFRCPISIFKNWVLSFLSTPNSGLGRKGAVCPFTKKSHDSHQFFINVQPDWRLQYEEVKNLILSLRDALALVNKMATKDQMLFNTISILFPTMPKDAVHMIDEIQCGLKPEFVRQGLMIGQFYPGCSEPGLHSETFRPLDSPISLIAIRNMVESDWVFLKENLEFQQAYKKLYTEPIHHH